MVKAITCAVRKVDGPEEEYVFDERPIAESVQSICKGFKLPYDEDENFYVLVAGSEPAAPVVSTRAQLLEAQERGRTLILWRGIELVQARLLKFEDEGDVDECLWGILELLRVDPWFADEVVEYDGVHRVIETVLHHSKKHVELAMVCLCELFRAASDQTWVEDAKEAFTALFFQQVFAVLFPPAHEGAPRDDVPAHASLFGCLFLLQKLPSSARAAHAAAAGALEFNGRADPSLMAFYPQIIDAMADDEDVFQRSAAESVLSAMAIVSVSDELLRIAIHREVVAVAGRDSEVGGNVFLTRCKEPQYFSEHLLTASLGACVDLAVAQTKSQEQSKALEKYVQAEKRLEQQREVAEKLRAEMRRQHQIMCRMVAFMRVENDPVVEQSLDGIIRFGWDSLHWKRGYSMLHYVAESVDDPSVVELVGLLATDIDKRDDDGMRPIDYARQSKHEGVIMVVEKLRRQKRAGLTDGFDAVPQAQHESAVDTEALRARLTEMPDLSPQLRQVIEMVLDVGWSTIEWPSNFSAMHLAAKCGHVGAVELLAAAGADLSTCDEWRLSPLDYAAQGKHHETILTIQRLITEKQAKGKQQQHHSHGARRHTTGRIRPEGVARRRTNRTESAPTKSEEASGADGGAGGGGAANLGTAVVTPASASAGSPGTIGATGSTDHDGAEQKHSGTDGASAIAELVAEFAARAEHIYVEPSAEARDKMVVPSGLRPELTKCCEAVRRKGWAKIQWPKGFSALHLAAQQGSEEVVTFLLEATAAPSLKLRDAKGWTPLEYAESKGNTQILHLLSRARGSTASAAGGAVAELSAGIAATGAGAEASSAEAGGGASSSSGAVPSRASAPAAAGVDAEAAVPPTRRRATVAVPGKDGVEEEDDGPQRVRHNSIHWSKVRTCMLGCRTTTDLLAEKTRARERPVDELGLVELRKELRRLQDERAMWQEERTKLISSKHGANGGAGLGIFHGPLDESTLQTYMVQYEAFGREAVLNKLMRPSMTGGLSFSETKANSAVDQLELVLRLCHSWKGADSREGIVKSMTKKLSKELGEVLLQSVAAEPAAEPAPEEAEEGEEAEHGHAAAVAPPPTGKGKKGPPLKGGKGPPPPPQQSPTEGQASTPADELVETAQAPPQAKGKAGKGKGPPPPGAKGAAAPQAEGTAEETQQPVGGGKGPPPPGGKPPPPGGKGPPPPGGKGPPAPGGKGPPAPGGKGPPPPGGKGPPAPGGKGPPAPGGKGPAAPGGKGPGGPAGAGKGAKGGKGGKAGGVQPTKPKIKPKKPMKPLWWSRLIMGEKLQPGESIWDSVTDDLPVLDTEALEARFAKAAVAVKKKEVKEEVKKEEVKILKIVTDPNALLQKETSLKKLPPAPECARALEELDDTALDEDSVFIIKEVACPTQAEFKQLTDAKAKEPNIPMGIPEQYMWVIGALPAYQMRVDCWYFIRTYVEKQTMYFKAISDFVEVIECVRDSEMLPSLMGLILATGNYLNGDTNRGQADGFDLEIINKLETIKDADGKDLRQFIFEMLFNKFNEKAAALVDEFDPMLRNVTRRLAKDSDGVERLSKQARIVFEDFDICIRELSGEFTKMNETMSMVLSFIEDPADQFKLRMPREFEKAKESINALVALRDKAKDDYGELLAWLKVQSMKSSDFCLLWDNLFVPGDLIVNKDAKTKANILVPTFCQGKPISIEDLMVLWEFKEPQEKPVARVRRKKRDKNRRKEREKAAAEAKEKELAAAAGGDTAAATGTAGAAGAKGKAAPGAKGKPAPGKGKEAASAPAPAAVDAADAATAPAATTAAGKGGKAKGPPGKGKPPAPAGSPAPAADGSAEAPASQPAATPEGAEAGAEASAGPAAPQGKGKAKGPPGKGKAPAASPTAAAEGSTPEEPATEPAAAPETAGAGTEAPAAPAAPQGKGKAKGPPCKGKAPAASPTAAAAEGSNEALPAPAAAEEAASSSEAAAPEGVANAKGKAKGPKGKGKVPASAPTEGGDEAPAAEAGPEVLGGKAKGKSKAKAPVAEVSPAAPVEAPSAHGEGSATSTPAAVEASANAESSTSPPAADHKGKSGKGKPMGPPLTGKGKATAAAAAASASAEPLSAETSAEVAPAGTEAPRAAPASGKGKAKGQLAKDVPPDGAAAVTEAAANAAADGRGEAVAPVELEAGAGGAPSSTAKAKAPTGKGKAKGAPGKGPLASEAAATAGAPSPRQSERPVEQVAPVAHAAGAGSSQMHKAPAIAVAVEGAQAALAAVPAPSSGAHPAFPVANAGAATAAVQGLPLAKAVAQQSAASSAPVAQATTGGKAPAAAKPTAAANTTQSSWKSWLKW